MTGLPGSYTLLILAALLSLNACDSGSEAEAPSTGGPPPTAVSQTNDTIPVEAADMAANDAAGAPVVTETLAYAEVDQQLVYGHFVFPADMVDPLPGIIVIHEWWGLNDNIRAMAERIAGEGYIVLAVDLFAGRSTLSPGDARSLVVKVAENPELANENIRQAYNFLRISGESPKIAALGWDFGGGWALNTAMLYPDELDAVVIFYGQLTDDEALLAPVNAPILGLFAEDDRGIPVATVRAFEQVLEKLGKGYEIEIYPAAQHSFADPSGPNYHAGVAEQAWSRVFEFLGRYLSD